jgi:hypothetical protein
MRKASIITVLLTALLMALSAPATASATTTTTNLRVPVDTILFGDCIGELHITGVSHVVTVVTVDDTGGFHFQTHENFRYEGTNLTTGDIYQASGVVRFGQTLKAPRFPATLTNVVAEHFISRTGPDLFVHLLFHFTVKPDGTTTAFVSLDHVRCR